MANLVNVRKDALTETFTYDDGTEETVDRIAYTVGEVAHTEDCNVTTRIAAGTGPKGAKEVKLADALGEITKGSLTECEPCAKLRAGEHQPNSATSTEVMNDTKESEAVPTKTLIKIELPDSLKPTPSIQAIVKALEEGDLTTYTTGEISKASGVMAAAANSAMLTLESAGIVTHTDTGTGKNKVRTWTLKSGGRPARKTAADYKKAMDEKPKRETAKSTAKATAAPAAKKTAASAEKATSTRVSVGVRQAKALEYLQKHPNIPKSVLHIEQGCGYQPRTLASVLARMAEKTEFPIQRAKTDAGRQGFMYVPEKPASTSKKK